MLLFVFGHPVANLPALALLALLLDAALGGRRPLAWLVPRPGRAARAVAEAARIRLDRPGRSRASLRLRGRALLLALILLLLCYATGLTLLATILPFGELLLLWGLFGCLSARHLWRLAALRLPPGAQRIRRSREAVARGLVAPLFWFLLLGLPGAALATGLRAAAAALGGANSAFAAPLRAADVALSRPPLALAALIEAGAALFVPQAHPLAALRGGPAVAPGAVTAGQLRLLVAVAAVMLGLLLAALLLLALSL